MLLALLAISAPTLVVARLPPSPITPNQLLAVIAFGIWLAWSTRPGPRGSIDVPRPVMPPVMALLLFGAAAAAACLFGALPAPFAWTAVGTSSVAMAVLCIAAALARSGRGEETFAGFAVALVVAGIAGSALGALQLTVPSLADGVWLAPLSVEGRAAGNLRQPNHLATLLLWAIAAAVWLARRRRIPGAGLATLVCCMTLGLVLTGSRGGVVAVVCLALWAAVDRRGPTLWRRTWLLLPLLYAVISAALAIGVHFSGDAPAVLQRFTTSGDVTAKRLDLWIETLAMIRQHPITGVGFGSFNLAWTMTPLDSRPAAYFDHAHNLGLHLAAELGLPLALLILGFAAWGFVAAGWRARVLTGPEGDQARTAFAILIAVAVHSQFEYPLWFAHFLLPTVFAWGSVLGLPLDPANRDGGPEAAAATSFAVAGRQGGRRVARLAALAVAGGGVFAALDYSRVVPIYRDDFAAVPIGERIARAQRSVFFSPHAAYAASMVAGRPSDAWPSIEVARYLLLDARLMPVMAKAYALRGDLDRARWVAARLREFNRPDAAAFFAACSDPPQANEGRPFQCEPPRNRYAWTDFR